MPFCNISKSKIFFSITLTFELVFSYWLCYGFYKVGEVPNIGSSVIVREWLGYTYYFRSPRWHRPRVHCVFAFFSLFYISHIFTIYYLFPRSLKVSEILFGPFICFFNTLVIISGVMTDKQKFDLIDWFSIFLFIGGMLLTTISEHQRRQYKFDNQRKTYFRGGLFSFCQYPHYLGEITLSIGWTLISSNWYLAIFPFGIICFFLFYQIPHMEREMKRQFGDEIKNYISQTPKLIPYIY